MWLVLGGKLRNPGFELRAWADCVGNRAQDGYVKRVLMVGGSGRTIELTGGRGRGGGGGLWTFFAELFFRGGPGAKRPGRAPPRLAKRHCRLHGSTVSAKSQNLKNQQKYIQNGTKGEPWMRAKRTLRVPWLTGFITLWPCAPKPRKNV